MYLTRIGAAVAALAFAGAAQATAITFSNITTNNGSYSSAMTSQISATLSDVTLDGTHYLDFHVANLGPLSSSITGVYFDDKNVSLVSGIKSLSASNGVSFKVGGSPNDLPSGSNYNFSADYWTTANSPSSQKGVNPSSEYLDVLLSYASNQNWTTALTQYLNSEFVIGLHIIAINGAGGQSDSYLSNSGTTTNAATINAVPEPASLALLGAGLFGLGMIRRRKSNSGSVRSTN